MATAIFGTSGGDCAAAFLSAVAGRGPLEGRFGVGVDANGDWVESWHGQSVSSV